MPPVRVRPDECDHPPGPLQGQSAPRVSYFYQRRPDSCLWLLSVLRIRFIWFMFMFMLYNSIAPQLGEYRNNLVYIFFYRFD